MKGVSNGFNNSSCAASAALDSAIGCTRESAASGWVFKRRDIALPRRTRRSQPHRHYPDDRELGSRLFFVPCVRPLAGWKARRHSFSWLRDTRHGSSRKLSGGNDAPVDERVAIFYRDDRERQYGEGKSD